MSGNLALAQESYSKGLQSITSLEASKFLFFMPLFPEHLAEELFEFLKTLRSLDRILKTLV
jgi:hypothetical protein